MRIVWHYLMRLILLKIIKMEMCHGYSLSVCTAFCFPANHHEGLGPAFFNSQASLDV